MAGRPGCAESGALHAAAWSSRSVQVDESPGGRGRGGHREPHFWSLAGHLPVTGCDLCSSWTKLLCVWPGLVFHYVSFLFLSQNEPLVLKPPIC